MTPGFLQSLPEDLSLRSFAIAGTLVGVAVAARAALDVALPNTPPFITLYPSVALAGLVCGPAAAAAAGLLGLLAAIYLWIPPRLSFAVPGLSDCVSVALFTVSSSVVLWMAAALRAQLVAATVAKEALDLGLAAGGVGTWEMNLRTSRINASPTALALHGLPDGMGQTTTAEDWLRGVQPEDLSVARTRLQAAVAGGTLATYTYRIDAAPDGTRWIAARGRVVASGGERRLLCALVDVTEQIRVQEELRRERERLRVALQAGALAVWDYDPTTGKAAVDTSYAATMGLRTGAATLTRAEIGEHIHPDDRQRVREEHEAAVARGSGYRIEYRILTPAGDIRWLLSQGIAVESATASRAGRLVGVIQDITDRKRREDELRDIAAARELLIREADHRIKNSLQLVISLLGVQLRGVGDPAAAEALRGAMTRVGAIAASHLALQGSEDLRQVDLAATLHDLCGHFARLYPAAEIVCRADAALMLDADLAIPLGLMVSEMLINALRHAFPCGRSGTVTVEVLEEASHYVLRVSDNGVGMQLQPEHAGLGSRIIRSLAARLSATVEAESTPLSGTAITLRMPIGMRGRDG